MLDHLETEALEHAGGGIETTTMSGEYAGHALAECGRCLIERGPK